MVLSAIKKQIYLHLQLELLYGHMLHLQNLCIIEFHTFIFPYAINADQMF